MKIVQVVNNSRPGAPPAIPVRAILVLLSVVWVAGCESPSQEASKNEGVSVSTTAAEGPVRVTLSATPGEVAFNNPVRLEIEVVADRETTVTVEDYTRALSAIDRRFEFMVRSEAKSPPTPAPEGKLRWLQTVTVEFFLPGDYELPSAMATFVDPRDVGKPVEGGTASSAVAEEKRVRTEPLTVKVLQPADPAAIPKDLANIPTLPPRELPFVLAWWWWVAFTFLALGMAGLVWVRLRRAELVAKSPPPIAAHEWARRRIAELVAEDLIGKKLIQEFHYRISDIVRGYVERRFEVSAPEMTTEEFLETAARDDRFESLIRSELAQFLEACDLVKYARRKAGAVECDQLLRTTETLIEQTREREVSSPRNETAIEVGP